MASAISPQEEDEYEKIREHEEELDDQWLTSVMMNQPPELRSGAKRSQRRGLFFCLKLEAPSGKVSSSRCSQLAQTTCQELASTLHNNSAYHGPWIHIHQGVDHRVA